MSYIAGDDPGRLEPVTVGTVAFDALTAEAAATRVRGGLARGEGGRVVLVDTDLHQRAAADPEVGAAIRDASLVLATSWALVWASRLAPTAIAGRLPTRVTPLALTDAVCAAGNADARRILVLGGEPEGPALPSDAVRAAAVLGLRHRGLRVAGTLSPVVPPDRAGELVGDVRQAKPDVVLIGMACSAAAPIVAELRVQLPRAWFIQSSALISSVLGQAHGRPGVATGGRAARLLAGALITRVAKRVHPRRV